MFQLTAMALEMPETDLSISERSVLLQFCSRANEIKGYIAWPSIKLMAANTGCSERTVRRAIQILCMKNFLSFVRTHGRAKIYRVEVGTLIQATVSQIKHEFRDWSSCPLRLVTVTGQTGHDGHLTSNKPVEENIMGVRDIKHEIEKTGRVGKLNIKKIPSIQSIWIEAWKSWKREHDHESCKVSLNQQKIGMLRSLEKTHGREALAPRIEFAVEHWSRFVSYCNEQTGENYHGNQPDVKFFAGNYQIAINFINDINITEKRIEFVKPQEAEQDAGVKDTLAVLKEITGK